jgi:hypothetical protein
MKVLALVLVLVLSVPVICEGAQVRGYWKDTDHDGIKDTYVEPHQRTNPNPSRMDNYSYPGNYNPNTGHVTPASNTPRQNYPVNPNPYETPKVPRIPNW